MKNTPEKILPVMKRKNEAALTSSRRDGETRPSARDRLHHLGPRPIHSISYAARARF